MLLDIDSRLRPDARSPAQARRSLEVLRPSLDDLLVDDAELLVSEIVSNCVRHASLDASDAIRVRIRGSNSMLHVAVIDPGPASIRMPCHPPGVWVGGDCGCSTGPDQVGVERNHVTRVWFELASPGFSLHHIGYVNDNREQEVSHG